MNHPDTYRVLTVCEPFASALIFGGKTVENRRWATRYRGPLFIHAGLGKQWMDPERLQWCRALWRDCPATPREALDYFKPTMGHIIGVVDLVDCISIDRLLEEPGELDGWHTGPYCWRINHPTATFPLSAGGQRGLWKIRRDELIDSEAAVLDDALRDLREAKRRAAMEAAR